MIISLKNVDVNALRTLFDRTLVVSNSLDFSISSSAIKSSVSNDDQNFWKEWAVPTKGLFESEAFESVKVLFSNGAYFKNKFLGLFNSQKCEMNITCNEKREAESIEVIGQTSFGASLKVNMRTTRYDLAKDPLEDELKNELFDVKNAITTFDIEPNIIKEINRLRGLNAMADNPVSYVTFKGEDGVLKAFDSSFEFTVSEYSGEPFEAKFPKKSLSLIDSEAINIAYCHSDEIDFDWFIIKGKNPVVECQCIAMLMTSMADADGSISDDIFGEDNSWGMGE